MLSKNNKQLMVEKQAAKKQRYGLRKLSIGVASVLLGMTFLGAGSISATENENLETATTENQVEAVFDPLNEQTEITLTPQAEAEKQTDEQAYEEKAVTRTINLYKDGELVDTKIQTVNFHKILGTWYVKNDGAVGVKTGQFDAYDIPEQAGYTAQVNGVAVDKVDNMSVTADTPNQVVDVYYVADTKTYTEERVITRTINIWHDDKLFDVIPQEVVFTREVTENLTTGEKTYGSWDEPTKMFDEVTLPQYEGYKHTEGTVQKRCIVNPNSENIVNDIKYMSEKENSEETKTVKRVISIYQDGKKVDEVTQVVEFSREVKKNLATGETYGEWVAKDGKDIWDAFDAPAYENYTTDTVKIDNKSVKPGMEDEEAAIYYTSIVETELEERVVDRTIILNLPNGMKREHVQSVTFKREVKKNLATGEVTYGEWDLLPTELEAYAPPKFEGYVASIEEVKAIIVDPDSQSTTVEVDYYKIYQQTKEVKRTFTVRVVDGVLPRVGTFGGDDPQHVQSVRFVRNVYLNAAGEIVATGNWGKAEETFGGFVIPQLEGYTTRRTVIESQTVTPDMEDIEDEILYVAYATHEDTKVVTRTITITDPDGKTHVVEQKATFTRQVLTDQFTGQKMLGDWSVDQSILEGITLPEFNGYKPSQQVDPLEVSPDSEDSELTITYEKVDQDTPTGPDNGDNEKPDTPTSPDNGDNEKPDAPTGPDNGNNETPDNGADKDPEATAGINNGGLENAKDELNSEAADQILNLSIKSNKDNGTMLKNMDSGQKGSNTKGLATQKDGNVASELPALGDETEVKGLGALLAALACMPLFLVAKGKKRKN